MKRDIVGLTAAKISGASAGVNARSARRFAKSSTPVRSDSAPIDGLERFSPLVLPRLRGRVGKGPAAVRPARAPNTYPHPLRFARVLPRKRGRKVIFTPPSAPRP